MKIKELNLQKHISEKLIVSDTKCFYGNKTVIAQIDEVVMIDIKTNNAICIFKSVQEASIYLQQNGKTKKTNQGSISNVCNGIRKTAGGYKWRWLY